MPSWDEIRKMVAKAQSQQEKEGASRAMQEYLSSQPDAQQLVTLQKGGLHSVRLVSLGSEMATNPEVYERVRKIVSGGS